ncbi:MAG: efflux RND transporter periplasmic adaptor subunit [Bryobacteraceae bacterium]|nr:efflux RND transporter periplasmic adaptor subunit [Bryobacteraceae bacterium]
MKFSWKAARPWVVFFLVCATIVGAGFGVRHARAVQNAVDLPTAPARKGEFRVIVPCRGEIVARRSVILTAPNVPNLSIVWTAPPGSPVKKGDLVIRFDASSAKQQLREKEAALQQANASLEQARAQGRITEEQDVRDLAAARYAVERARLEVSKSEVVSKIQAEESKVDLGISEEKLRVQEATAALNRASAGAKIASAKRLVDKAQYEHDLVKGRLDQMEIKAPLDGVVVFLNNNSRGWMNAQPFKVGDAVWPGSSIAEIPDLNTLELKGKVDEIDRGRLQPGQRATITVDSMPEKRFEGEIVAVSTLTETSWEWPPTRSFRTFAKFNTSDANLRPGMNGKVNVIVSKLPDTVSIPAKALYTRGGRPVVFVPAKNEYRTVPVEILARNPDEVAVKGIEAGTPVTLVEVEERRK